MGNLAAKCVVCGKVVEVKVEAVPWPHEVTEGRGECHRCGAKPVFAVETQVIYTVGAFLYDADVLLLCPNWAKCAWSGHCCVHVAPHVRDDTCMEGGEVCPDCYSAKDVLEDSASVARALHAFKSGDTVPWERVQEALIQEAMEGHE